MSTATRLGEFLRARRAQLRPVDVGLPAGARRRVPGLRREELAELAGVSPSYYTRLEQGQSRRASASVLDAIAAALRLGPDEHEHLRRLAAAPTRVPAVPRGPERVHAGVRELLDAMGPVPAWVQGRRTEILAWNRLGHALLAGHLDPAAPEWPADRPSTAELVFLDPRTRELYRDWPRKARAVVGNLRLAAGRHPADPELATLVAALTSASPEFAALWADHRIRACDVAAYELRHPVVGGLTVAQQSFTVVARPDQALLTMTAPAGSASARTLDRLRRLLGPEPAPAAPPEGRRLGA